MLVNIQKHNRCHVYKKSFKDWHFLWHCLNPLWTTSFPLTTGHCVCKHSLQSWESNCSMNWWWVSDRRDWVNIYKCTFEDADWELSLEHFFPEILKLLQIVLTTLMTLLVRKVVNWRNVMYLSSLIWERIDFTHWLGCLFCRTSM